MRFLVVLAIWIVCIGGLQLYTSGRDSRQTLESVAVEQVKYAKDSYTLHLTPTFSSEQDPFALQTSSKENSTVQIRLNGAEVSLSGEQFARGTSITIEQLQGIQIGHNELFVSASPTGEENMMDQAIRVDITNSLHTVVTDTIWSSAGALVTGTISFSILPETEKDDHDH